MKKEGGPPFSGQSKPPTPAPNKADSPEPRNPEIKPDVKGEKKKSSNLVLGLGSRVACATLNPPPIGRLMRRGPGEGSRVFPFSP